MTQTVNHINQALTLLDSPLADSRKMAILFLKEQQYKEGIPLLLDLLLNDPDPSLRIVLIQTLIQLEAREAIPYLLDLMQL